VYKTYIFVGQSSHTPYLYNNDRSKFSLEKYMKKIFFNLQLKYYNSDFVNVFEHQHVSSLIE